jgi:hypothetical protein
LDSVYSRLHEDLGRRFFRAAARNIVRRERCVSRPLSSQSAASWLT